MISIRQLLVIVLVALGIWLIKRIHSKFTESQDAASTPASYYQDMVVCQRCGTHIPREQASGNETRGYACNDKQCAVNNHG